MINKLSWKILRADIAHNATTFCFDEDCESNTIRFCQSQSTQIWSDLCYSINALTRYAWIDYTIITGYIRLLQNFNQEQLEFISQFGNAGHCLN